jgi:hypothetical protein
MPTEYLKLQKISPKPNYHEFLENHDARGTRIKCPVCAGFGKIRNPDERDPIEGYKMAALYDCTECNGEGYLSEQLSQSIYDMNILIWEFDQNYTLEYNTRIEEINKKLAMAGITTDDMNYIRTALK